jgi:poly-beta-1,6-N-acetyl-D-glucosamine synthase
MTNQPAAQDTDAKQFACSAFRAIARNPITVHHTPKGKIGMSSRSEAIVPKETYVLITAAHNEERYIEDLIRSVVNQSVLPFKWVIVSDASTDRTDQIVKQYASQYPFIQLLRCEGKHRHNFAAKDFALKAGYESLKGMPFGFVGILDADISLESTFFDGLLDAFKKDPNLGLTGGFIYEEKDGEFSIRGGNRIWSVAGATQFFRRACYEEIGGYSPLKYGGSDWCAEVSARMKGWTVRAIPELKVFHHRPTGTARNLLRYWFHLGRMDFSLGCHPIFEIAKCMGRMRHKPVVLGGLARLAGFVWSYIVRADRSVSKEFIEFLRKEQRQRLMPVLSKYR